jgi:hypothetical protein
MQIDANVQVWENNSSDKKHKKGAKLINFAPFLHPLREYLFSSQLLLSFCS